MSARILCFIAFCSLVLCAGVALDAAAEDGFTPLLNGNTLAGWKIRSEKDVPRDEWTVADGILKAKAGTVGWRRRRNMAITF